MVKYNINDIGGIVAKEDERYRVCDNSELNNLVLSSTDLHPNKSTSGHEHLAKKRYISSPKAAEKWKSMKKKFSVSEGDTVLIKDGDFHRVHAGNEGCYFVCVFDGKRSH